MNNALLYIGGFLIAVLAVLFAVPHFIDWNSYRGVFEEEASRVLGREVRVGGAVNVRFLPAPYLSFEKVRIADSSTANGGSIIRVDSFTMWLSVPPLLRGVIEANKVEVRRPVIQLATDASGSGNWATLTLNPGSMPFVPKDVALQSVSVVDGAIIVSTPARGELGRIGDINGELMAEALEGPIKFKGSVQWEGGKRQVRLATARQDDNGDVRFKASVTAMASANTYVLDGRLSDLKGRPKLDGELSAKLAFGQKPADAAIAPSLTAPPASATDEPSQTPTVSAKTTPAKKQDSDTATAVATTPVDQGSPGFDFRAKISGDATGVRLTDLSATLENDGPPQIVSGEAALSWADKTRLNVNLSSRWLDLDRLAGASDTIPLESARGLFEDLAAALPVEADTNATFEVDQLTLGGEPISNVRLAAARSGGPLEIKGVRASLPGGTHLELDGILTPGAKTPKLDGTLFLSGQSLIRFLGWGFRKPDIGEHRTDGPFALNGHFALADDLMEITEATAEISDTPLMGDVRLGLGPRKRLAIALEGTHIDAAQIGSGMLGLDALKTLFLGAPTAPAGDAAANTPPAQHVLDPASADLSLRLKAEQLTDGDRVLRDVDAQMALDRGTLTIPSLKFSTPEGLSIVADGTATNVPAQPRGTIRALVSAPTEAASNALLRLLDLSEAERAPLERLNRLAPMRVAATLTLLGNEKNGSTLALDGTMGGGRMTASVRLDGGQTNWRKEPADISATISTTNVGNLLSAVFDVHTDLLGSAAAEPGHLLVKAVGTPERGLLSLGEITSDNFTLNYNGNVSLPAPSATAATGSMRISATDARSVFALAGLKLAHGAAGVPFASNFTLGIKDRTLTLDSTDVSLGATKAKGHLELTTDDAGQRTIAAAVTADAAPLNALLSTVLAKTAEPPPPVEAAVTRRDARMPPAPPNAAPTPAPPDLWPENAFDLSALNHMSGSVTARIGALVVEPGLTITDAAVEAKFDNHGITVSKLTGSAVGGKLSSNLEFEKALAGVGLKGALRIDVASNPAAAASADAPGDVAALALDFSGRALSPAALVASLTGKGEITAGDATLTGMSPSAISAVIDAAVAGKGPASGEPLAQAIKIATKQGELKLGKLAIPVTIGDGSMKLDRVTIEAPEGRSTFTSVVELTSMKLDTEWQIEPKYARPAGAGAAPGKTYLPPVTIVYNGKLSALSTLEPTVSTSAIERELQVRKMERDVDVLERLRKQDQERVKQEKERRKALEAATPPTAETAAPPAGSPGAANPQSAPAPAMPKTQQGGTPDVSNGAAPQPSASQQVPGSQQAPVSQQGGQPPASADATVDPGVPVTGTGATASAVPGADPAAPPADPAHTTTRRRKPTGQGWSPFENSPLTQRY